MKKITLNVTCKYDVEITREVSDEVYVNFGGVSPNCGARVRPYLIRHRALAHKNPTRFSRGCMST